MKRLWAPTALLMVLVSAIPTFGQSSYATVSGTIEDSTKALIPGVTVTATNTATGVVTTVLSNEAGAYNFPSLLPGSYTISAQLPGFQTQNYTNVQLGNADKVRLNFTLTVGGVNTTVDVSIAADTLLATSSSSVGEVLNQQRIQDLPSVANNVLDLYRLMPGIRLSNDTGVQGTFSGLSAFGTVNIQRDGVDANGGTRWGTTAISATNLSPDLIGEVRMILAPVDAELGRGNAQIQFMTRSGTNRFSGTAVWLARNTALDANTWNNNNDTDPKTGQWKPTKPDWANVHEYTLSLGGPIVRNKTFFFALWNQSIVNGRSNQNPVVLTPCARNGIFRYFDNWNNGNALQAVQATSSTPTIAVVDLLGNPLPPATNPNGSAFTGALRYASVFGPLSNTPSAPDCSDAVVQGAPWDTNRTAFDSTGFVRKLLDKMPLPNNYEVGDGLNTAGFRWVRPERGGTEGIFGFNNGGISSPTNLSRRQINTKIDHAFNSNNKLAVSYSYERNSGNANYESWPGGFRGSVFRHPQTLSATFTSTLSPALVNEARFGMRRIGGNTYNGLNDPDKGSEAQAFFPNFNGYPVEIGLGTGTSTMNFQTNQPLGGGSTSSYLDSTVQWTYGDSLSWSRGKHAFKYGGEIRRGHSLGYDAGIFPTSIPRAVGGDLTTSAIPITAISSTNMPGLAGTNASGNNVRMRNLLSLLAGSLSNVAQFYYMQSSSKLDAYEDYKTYPWRIRDTIQNEGSVFFKDDWKILTNLTLNLGLRWDYYGSPYDSQGLMPAVVGGPEAIFGISGRSFDGWMKPGARDELTNVEFVGKNSPNPDKSWYPNDLNNFGPAIGFAWQVPWFGAGKTTVRGGFQITYNAGQVFNAITQENVVPGSTLQASYTGDSQNPYLDLADLPSLIPVPTIIKPMQPVPVTDRTQQIYNPQPGLVNPYVENITLSVTRSVRSNLTVDVRYIGVLGRKQWNAFFNLNAPNFLYNGLKEAFDAARRGDDASPDLQILEDMFKNINVAGSGFGPVGTTFNGVQQTAGMHLRASTNFRSNLANGNYSGLAATLNTLNYNKTFAGNSTLPDIPAGVNGAVIRLNGFPENFVVTNPQFTNLYMISNLTNNNYHSMEAQVTLRPTHGISMQSTYTFSRNFGVVPPGIFASFNTNPADRHADYTILSDTRVHDFRTNGSFALPIGPNKLFFSNSSGVLARIVENWQLGWIANFNSGAPVNIAAQNMLYANGTPDIVGPFDLQGGKVRWQDGSPGGSYFEPGSLVQTQDPQCTSPSIVAASLTSACTLSAVADSTSGQILLQNPLPGKRGTLGLSSIEGPGVWRFDANMTKAFRVGEGRTLQLRMDATNLLNHPEPGTPVFNINNTNFGQITGNTAKSNQHRMFQAQLRLTF